MTGSSRELLAGLVLAASLVSGETMAQDTVTAEALFDRGLAQMEAGQYQSGCPALQESYKLDPKAGALFALADCMARWGKVASAVAHLQDYVRLVMRMPSAEQARHRDRMELARAEIVRLEPWVPELTLVLAAGAPPDTKVKRDGVELGRAALGVGLPVDPGEHVITTQIDGGPEHVIRVSLAKSEKKRVELQVERTATHGPQRSASEGAANNPPGAGERTGSGSSTALWIAGGIGAAGLLAGTVTGLMVLGKKGAIDDNCEGMGCNPQGLSAAADAKRIANVSTACFGVGVAGMGTALVLLLMRPGKAREPARAGWQPLVGVDGAGAWVGTRARW